MKLAEKIALNAALALVAFSCSGCTPGAKAPHEDLIQCYVLALEPVVKDVFDIEPLVKDLIAGKASLSSVLQNLQVPEAEVKAVLDGLHACSVPKTLPSPNAGTAS